MTEKTDGVIDRAVAWWRADPDVIGVVLYGSAARRRTHAASDVDLIVVAQPGRRGQIWDKRTEVAARLLGADVAWSHDLPWQGSHRFQAWRADLLAVDLTIDDGQLEPHETFVTGQPIVIAGDITLPKPTSEPADRPDLAMETWVWLLGIHNQLQQDRNWDAYCQLVQLLDSRVRPLIGEAELRGLMPTELTPAAILTALQAAVGVYSRTRSARDDGAAHPLAITIHDHILAASPCRSTAL